jgi:hypothetical protein
VEFLLNLNEKVRKYPLQATLLLEIEFIRMIKEVGKGLLGVKVDGSLSLDEAKRVWFQVLERIRKEKISLWNCLRDSEVKDVKDRCVIVGLRNATSFKKDSVNREGNRRIIDKIFNELWGQKIEWCIEEEEREEEPLNNPIVKKVMELFGGKIIEVKNQ